MTIGDNTIPDDVMKAARAEMRPFVPPNDETLRRVLNVAILSERERCANIADMRAKFFGTAQKGQITTLVVSLLNEAAAAIRKGGE